MTSIPATPQSLLGSLALAYTPLWGTDERMMVGARLAMHAVPGGHVDALHWLQVLRSFWPHRNGSLILRPQTPDLLHALLRQAPDYAPCIELQDTDLDDPVLAAAAADAAARGVRLAWRGPWDARLPGGGVPTRGYACCIVQGNAEVAWAWLSTPGPVTPTVPLVHELPASERLAQACLSDQHTAATLGWPDDDVLLANRLETAHPSARSLCLVQQAISKDSSLEALENAVLEDPVLAYRLLIHVNSAASGLRGHIDTVRRALMMMGHSSLAQWCSQQLPHASQNPNLHPVRAALVLHADLAEALLDAGGEADMRSEVRLSALFSSLDGFLHEPMASILPRLPLPARLVEAMAGQTGMYAPYLRLARAMQSLQASTAAAVCDEVGMSLDDANRALLRTLGNAPVSPLALV